MTLADTFKKVVKNVNATLRNRPTAVLFILGLMVAVILRSLLVKDQPTNVKCRRDLFQEDAVDCRLSCNNGEFILKNMQECHFLLNCNDISRDVEIKHFLVEGTVKKVYLAEWQGHAVVVSKLQNEQFLADFKHNIKMLRLFSQSPYVVQLIGVCNSSILVTEYHHLGSALNVQRLLEEHLPSHDTTSVRIGLCISYVSILEFLHNGSNRTRVMCDSSTLSKTLSQYLLTTDLQLIANDLDALPELDHHMGGIVCGHRELQGDFVAPEQRWLYEDKEFESGAMSLYDEKTDIWKVPDICNWFLGSSREADIMGFQLFEIHRKCKSINPALRPSATEILSVYRSLLAELQKS